MKSNLFIIALSFVLQASCQSTTNQTIEIEYGKMVESQEYEKAKLPEWIYLDDYPQEKLRFIQDLLSVNLTRGKSYKKLTIIANYNKGEIVFKGSMNIAEDTNIVDLSAFHELTTTSSSCFDSIMLMDIEINRLFNLTKQSNPPIKVDNRTITIPIQSFSKANTVVFSLNDKNQVTSYSYFPKDGIDSTTFSYNGCNLINSKSFISRTNNIETSKSQIIRTFKNGKILSEIGTNYSGDLLKHPYSKTYKYTEEGFISSYEIIENETLTTKLISFDYSGNIIRISLTFKSSSGKMITYHYKLTYS